jgi:signal transduction histidine kinase
VAWPGVQIELIEPSGPCPARVDRAMIRQVLQNLCDNAARAVGDRGGTVKLIPGPPKAGWVTLEVVDDGPGIAEAVRARLFAPYVTTARRGEGMGLGLAISRKILLDHGGDLEFGRAAPGASFVLRLPAGSES